MSNIQNTINWFPGHMQKTTRLIKEKIKMIDIVIQILDARSISKTSNDEMINQIAPNKKIIKIALKGDLSDIKYKDKNILIGSIKNVSFRNEVLNKILKISDSKIKSLRNKGVVKPKIYIIVLGLPNVGKSSFINFISKKSQLITSNKPGVTKKNTWLKINDSIEMMDTPGVLFKKINNLDTGYILTLLKCVKWEITPKYDVIEYGYYFLLKNYEKYFLEYFKIDVLCDFPKFLEEYCENKKIFLLKNKYDFERALEKLYKDFSSGNICKINYEK